MKDLKRYTESVSTDMDAFFAEMMQDSNYRKMVNTEKAKLVSADAVLVAREAAGLSQQGLANVSGLPKTTDFSQGRNVNH